MRAARESRRSGWLERRPRRRPRSPRAAGRTGRVAGSTCRRTPRTPFHGRQASRQRVRDRPSCESRLTDLLEEGYRGNPSPEKLMPPRRPQGAFDVKGLQSANTHMFGWFVLVIAAIVAQWWLRSKLRDLGDTLARQQRAIEGLTRRLEAAERAGIRAAEAAPEVKPVLPTAAPATIPTPAAPAAAAATPPPAPVEKPRVAPPPILVQPAPVPRPAAADLGRPPAAAREAAAMPGGPGAGAQLPPPPPTVAPPPSPPPRVPFDWESLVGVKLFSAIAGIAL